MFTGVIEDDVYDDGIIDDENHDEELFQIQSGENDNKFVLVNTRIDYQYRSANLNNMCVYDFVSTLYKKINAVTSDLNPSVMCTSKSKN